MDTKPAFQKAQQIRQQWLDGIERKTRDVATTQKETWTRPAGRIVQQTQKSSSKT